MSVAGHNGASFAVGKVDEHVLQVVQVGDGLADGFFGPETDVGGDLVVAGAGGVQSPRGRPDDRREARLDVHVDVFELLVELETALLYFIADLQEAGEDLFDLGRRDDAGVAEHAGVGDGPLYVLQGHAAIDVNRGRVGLDDGVGGAGEASRPEFGV